MNESAILSSMREVFAQGELLLGMLDDRAYAAKIPEAFNSSIGAHYRHCLDHFRSIFDGLETGEVNYDHRQRDPRVETIRMIALKQTRDLIRTSERFSGPTLSRSIRVQSKLSYAIEESPSAVSSLGREIMYCVAHAIHHYALIRVMGGMLGVPLSGGFGIAPATLKHLESATPARSRRSGPPACHESVLQQRAA